MKNRLIIFLSLFILLGCPSQKNTTSYSKKQYNEYVSYYNRLKMSTSFDESCDDCSIQLITNKISNKKIRYDIIINNPVIEMKNIKAIAFIDKKDKNIPSIGLLEKDTFSLKPNYIDKKNGYYKGINLSGTTSKNKFDVKLYLTYNTEDKQIERYIILHGNAT